MSEVMKTQTSLPDLSEPPPIPWRKCHALGLPEGSIRALLAIAIFGTIWVMLSRRPYEEIPDYLRDLLFIVMGHYFASRRRVVGAESPGPGPLFLPRGSIRVVLFGGFAVVAVLLYRRGRLLDPGANPGVVTLMLVVGFLLGVALARVGAWWRDRGHRVPRWIEDGKALVAMAAALVLIVMVWNRYDPILISRRPLALTGPFPRIGTYGTEHVVSAIVGFYFGSRS